MDFVALAPRERDGRRGSSVPDRCVVHGEGQVRPTVCALDVVVSLRLISSSLV